jgi:hypothetical protein
VGNRSKALLNVLAAIVLAGAVVSKAYGVNTAEELRRSCEDAVKCSADADTCEAVEFMQTARCIAYIKGFRGGHFMGMVEGTRQPELTHEELSRAYGVVCVPPEASFLQLAQVFIKYINDHPEELHGNAYSQLWISLRKAFPCE